MLVSRSCEGCAVISSCSLPADVTGRGFLVFSPYCEVQVEYHACWYRCACGIGASCSYHFKSQFKIWSLSPEKWERSMDTWMVAPAARAVMDEDPGACLRVTGSPGLCQQVWWGGHKPTKRNKVSSAQLRHINFPVLGGEMFPLPGTLPLRTAAKGRYHWGFH